MNIGFKKLVKYYPILLFAILQLFACKNNKTNICYIDNNKLINEYKGMEQARTEFQQKTTQWQANVDTLIAQFTNDLKSYEKERKTMSEKERELKEELLTNKQQQVQQYQDAMQRKAQEEDQLITQSVLNEINDYVKEYGKKNGYSLILGANTSGNVVYGDEGLDITEDILKGLNEEYEKTH